jgi:hypothetical protein
MMIALPLGSKALCSFDRREPHIIDAAKPNGSIEIEMMLAALLTVAVR